MAKVKLAKAPKKQKNTLLKAMVKKLVSTKSLNAAKRIPKIKMPKTSSSISSVIKKFKK